MNGSANGLGLVVVDAGLNLVGSNAEAIRILTFPERPEKIFHLDRWLTGKVRTDLVDRKAIKPPRFVEEFRSAKRIYCCRSFPLNISLANRVPGCPAQLLLLERRTNGGMMAIDLCERFGLTPREQETVQALLQGLTSKEIAQRMNISPNTVKAFIRLVMLKMNVSTRSGIIGKLVEPATKLEPLNNKPWISPTG